jgi:hypothetical protein
LLAEMSPSFTPHKETRLTRSAGATKKLSAGNR